MRQEVDAFVCLAEPSPFRSVGEAYADFHQLEDQEVMDLLSQAAAFGGTPGQ
ncbi:hypothetical protein D3C77_392300 [compost metagenome]